MSGCTLNYPNGAVGMVYMGFGVEGTVHSLQVRGMQGFTGVCTPWPRAIAVKSASDDRA